ncbi:hypothetical protein CFP56_013363 [Quercus suber]|uniref:Uncharacterized protein n=1 Tax=Quercus suber TaxID=58331 RepID=A0AAW0KW11_QUESU
MMSFTSYLQNWLIDTKIEQVDTQYYCRLVFELVILFQWPILSKAVIYFLTSNFCLTRRLVFHLVEL